MTKKIFAMFLAVLMVISLLPTSVFAAEKTCPGKGNHTPDNCNNTAVKVVDPTCSVKGHTRYKCNDCGEEFDGSYVNATGKHNYVATEDKAPTCEATGYKGAQKCTECGDVKAATTIPALNEGKYDCQWEIVNNATCTEGGTQEWKCSVCGATKTVKVAKGEHKYGKVVIVKAATATENGLATRTCEKCDDVKEVVVFADHDCKDFLQKIEYKAPTCTTTGVKAHYECRVCDKYWKWDTKEFKYVEIKKDKDIAKLTLAIKHSFEDANGKKYEPTCADTLLYCVACKKWVNPGVEHDIDWKITDGEKERGAELVLATCVKPGYIYDVCKNCEERRLKILDALGHSLVTVTVPATCQQIAYTYSYCTRATCAQSLGSSFDVNGVTVTVKADEFSAVTAITHASANVEAGFYFGFYQGKLDTTLFFNGEMSGKFLATTNDVSKAAKVYVELVSNGKDKKTNEDFNGYRLFFYDAEGTKTYITMEEYKDGEFYKANVVLTTETPATYYTWTAGYFLYTPNLEEGEASFRFGTFGTYDTISATESYYWSEKYTKGGQYWASLGEVGKEASVQVVSSSYEKDAKIDATNHIWAKQDDVAPECTKDGSGHYYCLDCGMVGATYTIPAKHNYEKATDADVASKNEKASKAVGCTDGYQWYKCADCGDLNKVVLTGYGHVMAKTKDFEPSHKQPTGYDTTSCRIDGCDHVVKGTYRVWKNLNKVYTSVEEAQLDGWKIEGNGTLKYAGDCTNAARYQYTCTCGCKKNVIIHKTSDGAGQHMMAEGDYVAPDCTTAGGYYSFKCSKCNTVVGSKPVAASVDERTSANWNTIDALGHDFVISDKHECEDCDSPDYKATHSECSRCSVEQKCFVLNETLSTISTDAKNLCTETIIEYYYCRQCDADHIRSYVEKQGHDFTPVLGEDGKIKVEEKSTCTKQGYYYVECTICGAKEKAYLELAAHKNKDGVEFWDKCNDTVEDRHCVNCCKCGEKGSKHDCVNNKVDGEVVPCDCVIGTNHTYKSVMMPSSCDTAPYYMMTCTICGAIKNVEVEEYIDADGNKVTVKWTGHKPAEVDYLYKVVNGVVTNELDKENPQYYKGFKYDEYTHYWYTVENGNWVEHSETYIAKFIERKDATYTEEGYDLMYCQICKSEEKNIKEKLTGLGFQMTVTNANGAEGFTYGSLIEVTISANGNDVSFYGFEFNVESTVAGENAADALRFVGYEAVNPNFNVAVSNAATALANKKVNVVGYANNDASGKMQNISVNGKTDLVKLYFRVVADNAAEYTFGYTAPVVKKISNYTAQEVQNITANLTSVKAKVAKYMDFNNDGFVSTSDAFLAMTLITGEQLDGLTYNVSIDIDKDGEITLADLSALYEHLVGNKSVNDLFKMGIDADELTILGLGKKTVCNNSACKKEISADATYCPFCGNHQ